MSETNGLTIASYEANLDKYVAGTPTEVTDGVLKSWLDATVEGMPPDSRILEIGSGLGRDAAYLETKGFRVRRTDATISFVNYLREVRHKPAEQLNVLTDNLPGDQDVIFADAVFLHFTPEENAQVFNKAFNSLRPLGRFAFSLTEGDGGDWSNAKLNAPRYFYNYSQRQVEDMLSAVGFAEPTVTVAPGSPGRGAWLHFIAERPE